MDSVLPLHVAEVHVSKMILKYNNLLIFFPSPL